MLQRHFYPPTSIRLGVVPFFAGGDNSKLLILLCFLSIKLSVKLLIEVFVYVESESGIVFTVRKSHSQWNGHAIETFALFLKKIALSAPTLYMLSLCKNLHCHCHICNVTPLPCAKDGRTALSLKMSTLMGDNSKNWQLQNFWQTGYGPCWVGVITEIGLHALLQCCN